MRLQDQAFGGLAETTVNRHRSKDAPWVSLMTAEKLAGMSNHIIKIGQVSAKGENCRNTVPEQRGPRGKISQRAK